MVASRAWRTAVVIALLVVTGSAYLVSNPGFREAALSLVPGYVPVSSQERVIRFRHTVPWGALSLDGIVTRADQATVAHLAPGRHVLRYVAGPFPTLSCALSVPAAPGDTCPLYHNTPQDAFVPPPLARTIDLGDVPGALSPVAHATLIAAIQSSLQAGEFSLTLSPGDHFTDASGAVRAATGQVTATLSLTVLSAPPDQNSPHDGAICVPLCPLSPSDWSFEVPVRSSWTFVSDGGDAGAVPMAQAVDDVYLVPGVTWLNGWHVAALDPLSNSLGCGEGYSQLQGLLLLSEILVTPDSTSVSNPGECLFILVPDTTPLASSAMFVLYRFGALIAANDEAHALLPTLPTASPHEVDTARRLAAST